MAVHFLPTGSCPDSSKIRRSRSMCPLVCSRSSSRIVRSSSDADALAAFGKARVSCCSASYRSRNSSRNSSVSVDSVVMSSAQPFRVFGGRIEACACLEQFVFPTFGCFLCFREQSGYLLFIHRTKRLRGFEGLLQIAHVLAAINADRHRLVQNV